jgi:comEA protein
MDRLILSLFVIAMLAAGVPQAQTQGQSAPARDAKAPAVIVNLNTATLDELQTLPGIGASTAARILEYRQKNGPFKKIEELMNVRGVGEKSFLKLRSQITVAGKPDAGRSQQ